MYACLGVSACLVSVCPSWCVGMCLLVSVNIRLCVSECVTVVTPVCASFLSVYCLCEFILSVPVICVLCLCAGSLCYLGVRGRICVYARTFCKEKLYWCVWLLMRHAIAFPNVKVTFGKMGGRGWVVVLIYVICRSVLRLNCVGSLWSLIFHK